MKILKKVLLFLICISVSSCTIFNSTKSEIKLEGIAETSDQDIVTSLTRSYSDSAFFGLTFTRGNNLQYIVNYDETKGILFHIYPFSGSSTRYPLRVGDYDNLYEYVLKNQLRIGLKKLGKEFKKTFCRFGIIRRKN